MLISARSKVSQVYCACNSQGSLGDFSDTGSASLVKMRSEAVPSSVSSGGDGLSFWAALWEGSKAAEGTVPLNIDMFRMSPSSVW